MITMMARWSHGWSPGHRRTWRRPWRSAPATQLVTRFSPTMISMRFPCLVIVVVIIIFMIILIPDNHHYDHAEYDRFEVSMLVFPWHHQNHHLHHPLPSHLVSLILKKFLILFNTNSNCLPSNQKPRKWWIFFWFRIWYNFSEAFCFHTLIV